MRLLRSHLAVAISAFVLLASCGGGAKSESGANTGAIAFSLKWPGSANVSSKPSTEEDQALQAVNCISAGIDTIYAEVWDGNTGQFLNVSATFLCSFGQGKLSGITAGTNRLVRMFGKDAGGTTLYRGTQSGISVTAGSTTAAGAISMSSLSSELSSIAITPADPSIEVAGTQQMLATGTYTDATTGDITTSVSWNSTETGVASITGGGLVTGVGAGDSVITATSGTVFTSTVVTVTVGSVTLTSIAVTPSTKTLTSISETQQLTATATYDDASTPDVTTSVTWSSSDDSVASVSSSGLVTAIGNSATAATITATLGGVSGTASVTVTISGGVTLTSIAVTPATVTIDEGATQAFTATGTYSDSSEVDLTSSATWTSSVVTVATIVDTGIATGTGLGTIPDPADDALTISTNVSTITATIGSITNTATLSVQPLPEPPANVAATAGNNQVSVSWDSATGATSYNIYWDTSSGVTTDGGTAITDVTSPYSHTSLTGGTTYYYIVTAVSDGSVLSDTVYYSVGEGDASSEVSAAPTDSSAPSVTGTTPTNDTTPTWSWTTSGGLGNYRYKLDDSDLANGATSTTGTNYTASTLAEGDHTLYVQEDMGGSTWSPTGSFTITVDLTAPDAPSVSGTTPTNDTTPTWDWTTSGGNESYRYQLDSEAGSWTTTASTTYTSGTLAAGAYTLYVQESDAAGNWSSSGSFEITIDVTAPTAPSVTGTTPTNDTTPTWSWTAGGGGNGNYQYQLDSEAGSWTAITATSYTPGSAISEGSHTLYVQESDAAGNWSTSGSYAITIDATAPTAPSVTGTTPTNDTTPTWSWTAGGGGNGTFRYQLDSEAGTWTTAASPYTPDSPISEGAHTLYVQERDDAGNWSTSGSLAITIDTTGPTAPSVTGTTPTTDTTPTWSWSAGGGGNGNYRWRFDDPDLTTPDGTGTDISYTASVQSDGTYTLYVQEQDSVGNWSSSGSYAITIDTTPPNAPSVTGTTPTSDTTPTWNWTPGGGGNGNYRYELDDSDLTSGATTTTATSYTPSSAISEGSHTLYVQEQDDAGNWSTSGNKAITIDNTAPTAPTVSGSTPTQDLTPTWTWSSGGGGSGSYRYELDNGGAMSGATTTTSTSYTPATDRTLTTHTLWVQEQDDVGNWSPSGNFAILIDNIQAGAPAVTGTTPTADTTPMWTWTPGGGGNGTYRWRFNNSDLSTPDGTGTGTFYTASAQSDGTYTVYVQERNLADTTWSASGSFAITIDTTAPSAPVITSPTTGTTTNDNTPTVIGTAEANSGVELFDTDGSTSLGTGTADSNGDWTVTSSTLSDATHSLTAKATDSVGNTSAASAAISITIDTTAPTVWDITPRNGVTGVVLTASIGVQFDENMDTSSITTSTFTVDNGVSGSIYIASSTIAYFIQSANLVSGTTYTVTITTGVKDVAGNALATQYQWSFTAGSSNWNQMIWDEDKWGP